MSVESLDVNKAIFYRGSDGDEPSWSRYDSYFRVALQRLEASGAGFAVIASNSPHHRLPSIVRGIRIPVLDIWEVVAKESARIGTGPVLILGTALTMSAARFREEFAKRGIEAAGPNDEATRAATIALIEELQLGSHEGAAERLGKLAKSAFEWQFTAPKPVVCLTFAELPLAFPEQ